jgi:hypothetical protein
MKLASAYPSLVKVNTPPCANPCLLTFPNSKLFSYISSASIDFDGVAKTDKNVFI